MLDFGLPVDAEFCSCFDKLEEELHGASSFRGLGRLGQRLGQFLSLPLIAVELPVNAPFRVEHDRAKIVEKTSALIGKSKVELRDQGSRSRPGIS